MRTHQTSESSEKGKLLKRKRNPLVKTDFSEEDQKRFWMKVKMKSQNDCWTWTAGRNGSGYGAFKANGGQHAAHRVSYELSFGKIQEGLFICHRCDNPVCVNPRHLFVGTHKDNMKDMSTKGRSASGERHISRLHPERLARGDRHGSHLHPERVPRGERNGNAKMTSEKVRQIREALLIEGVVQKEIAKQFGVSAHAVSKLNRNKSWKHVPLTLIQP